MAPIRYKLDVDTGEQIAANQLDLNEIGVVQLELGQPVAFDPYVENRDTGGFILIDRITNHPVGAGLLRFALRRSDNVAWEALEIGREARAELTRGFAGDTEEIEEIEDLLADAVRLAMTTGDRGTAASMSAHATDFAAALQAPRTVLGISRNLRSRNTFSPESTR